MDSMQVVEFARMKSRVIESILIQIAGVDTDTEYENIASERLKSINICIAELYIDGGTVTVIKSDLGDLAVVRAMFNVGITSQFLMDLETLPWNRKG